MPKMTGGEALAKQLHREGVRVVFGLPGVQLYGAMAALRDEKDIRFILTRHEQATTYMADGYARTGGGVGVALVVPGPGVLNAGAGLSTAYSCSSPVFLVAGQVPKRYLGKDEIGRASCRERVESWGVAVQLTKSIENRMLRRSTL